MLVMLCALFADLTVESRNEKSRRVEMTIKPEPTNPPATIIFLLDGRGFLGSIGSSINFWEEVVSRSYFLSWARLRPFKRLRYWFSFTFTSLSSLFNSAPNGAKAFIFSLISSFLFFMTSSACTCSSYWTFSRSHSSRIFFRGIPCADNELVRSEEHTSELQSRP